MLEVARHHVAVPEVAVSCHGLVKRFAELVAVNGLDLEVQRGECVGLLGPNGAGKTTTIEILEGLLPADGGEVTVLGQRWGTRHDRRLRERIGIHLQETQLAERLTVTEVVELFRSLYQRGKSAEEVLALLDLEAKKKTAFFRLSGGQKQRLALACALVSDPELLFLDEPTTGLDPQARQQIWRVLRSFLQQGGTVLLTTHYMEEAAQLCDRVVIMDHGRQIACGAPRELIASLRADHLMELHTLRPLDTDALAAQPGVVEVLEQRGGYLVHTLDNGSTLTAVLGEVQRQGAPLASLSTRQPTLDDVFLRLTGRGLADE